MWHPQSTSLAARRPSAERLLHRGRGGDADRIRHPTGHRGGAPVLLTHLLFGNEIARAGMPPLFLQALSCFSLYQVRLLSAFPEINPPPPIAPQPENPRSHSLRARPPPFPVILPVTKYSVVPRHPRSLLNKNSNLMSQPLILPFPLPPPPRPSSPTRPPLSSQKVARRTVEEEELGAEHMRATAPEERGGGTVVLIHYPHIVFLPRHFRTAEANQG